MVITLFFKKSAKIDTPLARLMKRNERAVNYQHRERTDRRTSDSVFYRHLKTRLVAQAPRVTMFAAP